MVRKTVTINDELFETLEVNHLMDKYHSFSEMVSSGLQLLIEKQKKEQYKKAMLEASTDPLYIEDMQEVEEDFKYADIESER
jgi:Arc/MetJ-type ribon-helix-helix transcriptional regulator